MSSSLPRRVVDSHHHLWDLAANYYPWLSGPPQDPDDLAGVGPLQRGYSAEQYLADTSSMPELRSVHVEAGHDPDAPLRETAWLDATADRWGVPDAIVAHAALEAPGLEDLLAEHARSPRLRGIRQMLDIDPVRGGHAETRLLDNPTWEAGLEMLAHRGLSFDLQVLTSQLSAAARTARDHPGVTFVLNHGGYHARASEELRGRWLAGLADLGACANVYAKSSAFEAVDPSWPQAGLADYVGRLLDAFGPDRVMFGSNFPVDRRTVTFADLVGRHAQAVAHLDDEQRDAYFYGTAARVYRLPGS